MEVVSLTSVLDSVGVREVIGSGWLSWSLPVDTIVTVTVGGVDIVLEDLVRVCLLDNGKVYFQYDRVNFLLNNRFVYRGFLLGVVGGVVFG